MTTDMQKTTLDTHVLPPFGSRLQSAREALGLEIKDAAAQLRLNEKVIALLETNCYGTDIPPTFVRGYLRSYGKLLQIPEQEIKDAIEPIKQSSSTPAATIPVSPDSTSVTSSNTYMQLFTYLIILTMVTLMAVWWYGHSSQQPTAVATLNISQTPIKTAEQSVTFPLPIKTEAVASNINLGAKVDSAPAVITTAGQSTPAATTAPTATKQPLSNALASNTNTHKTIEEDDSEEE